MAAQPSLFVKTRLCRFYQSAGTCAHGSECSFAHKPDELRTTPDLRRTKYCPAFLATGACSTKGCPFAHTREQRRRLVPHGGYGAISRGMASPRFSPKIMAMGDAMVAQPSWGSCSWMNEAEDRTTCASSSGGTSPTGYTSPTPSIPDIAESRGSNVSSPRDFDSALFVSNAFCLPEDDLASSLGDVGQVTPTPSSGSSEGGHCESRKAKRRAMKNKFHKTRICNYFLEGHCRKGHLCKFAHEESDLKPLPDLTCTKLCPRLAAGGCSVEGCMFAHNADELRTKAAEASFFHGRESGCEPSDPSCSAERLPSRSSRGLELRVKNTFLCVEEPRDQREHRRGRSAPGSLRSPREGPSGQRGASPARDARRRPCRAGPPASAALPVLTLPRLR